jgi:hypothetical protein
MHIRLIVSVVGIGVFFWTLAAFTMLAPLGTLGAIFSAYWGMYSYGGLIHSSGKTATQLLILNPAPLFQTVFWLMLASWMGAWFTAFTLKWPARHGRYEAEHLAYLGALQTMFPIALPLLPVIYYVWARGERPETAQKGWEIEDWLPGEEKETVKKKAMH